MKQLGLGVMINMLSGNAETVESMRNSIGKVIKSVKLEENKLKFVFNDESRLTLWDDGQSCCESRYMSADGTDLDYFVGQKLVNVEIADAPSIPTKYEDHDVQFLHIKTDKGTFTLSNHNEHNGYYGGFDIEARN